MCSRYELDEGPRAMVRRFDLPKPPPTWPVNELRPTNRAPVIVVDDGGRRAVLPSWGLPASWDNKPLINARAETLSERKTFRPLLGNRCLVPATAYFEWRKDGRHKRKNRIAPAAGGLFAFAGLMDGDHFTIITCAPAPDIAHIHNRMPVILARDGEAPWLERERPFEAVAPLLVPFTGTALRADEEHPAKRQGDLFGPG
jgi:putative SOS response-associated peptidase YedK